VSIHNTYVQSAVDGLDAFLLSLFFLFYFKYDNPRVVLRSQQRSTSTV